MNKLMRATGSGNGTGEGLAYWCQGCEDVHVIWTQRERHPVWSWDGNTEAPTFEPSVLVTSGHFTQGWKGGDPCWCNAHEPEDRWPVCVRCHTFVRGGMVQFLSDSSHAFSGQTVALPDWPYEDGAYGGVEPLE